jgi:hypothetical protein
MTAAELTTKLEARGKSCLHNKQEVTDPALETAVRETIDFIGAHKVKEFAVMDFAFTRLKIYLKITLTEEDELLYKAAIKEIESSPVIDDEGNTKYLSGVVERGESVWEN